MEHPILQRLDKCPFCNTLLHKREDRADPILDCPNEKSHPASSMWAWYSSTQNEITALNIRCSPYQIHLSFRENRFVLLGLEINSLTNDNEVFSCSLDGILFSLDEDSIRNKIKTILTFL